MKFTKEKGITLIALVITIILLIILSGTGINLVLGKNGLFERAKNILVESQKASFIEDVGLAYVEAYMENIENSSSDTITISDVISILKSSYGYTDEQIKNVPGGVTDIKLNEKSIILRSDETKQVTVTLENNDYYVLIEDLYYPIIFSDIEITLGKGIKNLPKEEESANEIEATATLGDDLIEVTTQGTTITIKGKEDKKGEAAITVSCGSITKTINVTVRLGVKQGYEVPLGPVEVTVKNGTKQLAKNWLYFYEENEKVWLIYNGIMEGEVLQTSETIQLYENNIYSTKDRQDLLDYINGEGNYSTVWEHIKTGIKRALDEKGISVIEDQIEVKGAPDIKIFQKAYNKMYPDEQFEVEENDTGWQYKFGETGVFVGGIQVNNYVNKPLFFISNNYWLANASAYVTNVCRVFFGGYFDNDIYNNTVMGIRPVISIPASVFYELID